VLPRRRARASVVPPGYAGGQRRRDGRCHSTVAVDDRLCVSWPLAVAGDGVLQRSLLVPCGMVWLAGERAWGATGTKSPSREHRQALNRGLPALSNQRFVSSRSRRW